MLRDAYAARRLLIGQGMAADRMGIIGWSRGGTVALAAADGTFIPEEAGGFRAAIAFYPGCNFRTRVPKPRSLLFVAIGEKDDYTGVKQCQDVVDDFGKAGGKVSLKLYPGSGHQFDGDPSHSRMNRDFMAETSTGCSGYVEEDGEASFAGKKFNLESGFNDLLVYARQTGCIGHGATMWTNMTQREVVQAGPDRFPELCVPARKVAWIYGVDLVNVISLAKHWIAAALLVSAAMATSAQEIDPVEMLGGFDRIAEACMPGGSEAALTAVRVRLFRQTLGALGGATKTPSDKEIEESMAATRKSIADDAGGALKGRYEAGRRGVEDTTRLAKTRPQDFDRLCKSSRALGP